MAWLALLVVTAEHLRGAAGRGVLDRLSRPALRVPFLLAVLHAGLGLATPGTPVWSRLPTVVAAHWILVLPLLWVSVRDRSRWRFAAIAAGFPILILGMSAVRLPTVLAPGSVGFPPGGPFEVRTADGLTLRGLRFGAERSTGVVILVHGIGAEKCQFLPAVERLDALDGLILDSTFAELRAVGARTIPWIGGWDFYAMERLRLDLLVLGERVLDGRPGDGLAATRVPVLILHAAQDSVVPVAESARLAAIAGPRANRVVLPGRGHETGFAHAATRHRAALLAFARALRTAPHHR